MGSAITGQVVQAGQAIRSKLSFIASASVPAWKHKPNKLFPASAAFPHKFYQVIGSKLGH